MGWSKLSKVFCSRTLYTCWSGVRTHDLYVAISVFSPFANRAVASVRQEGQMPPPPLNFGPEVQYSDEFLKKDYMLFVFIVIQNEKVGFFSLK